jgi:excisionase family DNA binding protein
MEKYSKNITPVWNRYILTIVEAAEYYHIGEKKLRRLVDEHPKADFIIMNGNRVLLKKKQFERFLDDASYV